jgi:hypothetical protein
MSGINGMFRLSPALQQLTVMCFDDDLNGTMTLRQLTITLSDGGPEGDTATITWSERT